MITNRELLIETINNLNDQGIDLFFGLLRDCDKIEKYNINTTPERLAELQEIEKQKAEQEDLKRETDMERASYERAREKRKRQDEFKASLTGKEKRFYEVVNGVKSKFGSRYSLEMWELLLLSDTYNNNLLDGSGDVFWHGFIKGQRAERYKQKARARQ